MGGGDDVVAKDRPSEGFVAGHDQQGAFAAGPPILSLAGKSRWRSADASKLYLVWPCWA
jgi:hypothetical protein